MGEFISERATKIITWLCSAKIAPKTFLIPSLPTRVPRLGETLEVKEVATVNCRYVGIHVSRSNRVVTVSCTMKSLLDDDELGKNYLLSFDCSQWDSFVKTNSSKTLWHALALISNGLFLYSVFTHGLISAQSVLLGALALALIVPKSDAVAINSFSDKDISDDYCNAEILQYPWNSYIHQRGRRTLFQELHFLVNAKSWEDDRDQLSVSLLEDSSAIPTLNALGKRVKGLARRVVREATCSERLRTQFMKELDRGEYLDSVLKMGVAFQYIEELPQSWHSENSVYALAQIASPIDAFYVTSFRLWFLKLFVAHLVKRYLVKIGKYPPFDVQCIICQEKKVSVAFLGCKHAVACGKCARHCFYSDSAWGGKCPLCRVPISSMTDESLARISR